MPSTVYVNSKAKRPKNSWLIQVRRVSEVYQAELIYTNSKGDTGPFSSSSQNVSVKVPWGPPVSCEWTSRRVESELKHEFKFKNARGEIGWFDKSIMNNLGSNSGITAFDQFVTKLCMEKKDKLLGIYITLMQHSKDFIYNSHYHDEEGFSSEPGAMKEVELLMCGGSRTELETFIDLAKTHSKVVDKVQSIQTHKTKGKRYMDEDTEDKVVKPPKLSNAVIIDNNERKENEDPNGLEKNIQDSYVGLAWIPLDSISVPKDIIKVNPFKVQHIMNSIKTKYDPTLTTLKVCPVDDSTKVDVNNLETREFFVIQKVHTLMAFKELDKLEEFKNLVGHQGREVLAYVIDTNSTAMMLFSNLRSNEIDSRFVSETCPQQLLSVFHTLRKKDPESDNLKTVERMAKHCRIGPNETYSILKLCKWSVSGMTILLKNIEKYEVYETRDVNFTSRLSDSLSKGKKLKVPNSLFNKLARCDEEFYVRNCFKVTSGELSIRELVDENMRVLDVDKVVSVLNQLSGYQGIERLNTLYPTKFSIEILENFVGADIKCGKKNQKCMELDKHYNKVINAKVGHPVKASIQFNPVADIDSIVTQESGDNFDAIVVHMKTARQDLVMSIIKSILESNKDSHCVLLIYPNESLQRETLEFMRSQKLALVSSLKVCQILFEVEKPKVQEGVMINVHFGVLFGKFDVVTSDPLKILYNGLKNVADIISSVVPEGSRIAMISDKDVSVIQIHGRDLKHEVTYFASQGQIERFKSVLVKDKTFFDSNEDNGVSLQQSEICLDSSTSTSNEIPIAMDSTTSPVKLTPDNISPIKLSDKGLEGISFDDSGVQLDSSQMSSTQKNVYDFDPERENFESGIRS